MHDAWLREFLGVPSDVGMTVRAHHREAVPHWDVTLQLPEPTPLLELKVFPSGPHKPAWLQGPVLSVAYQLLADQRQPKSVPALAGLLDAIATHTATEAAQSAARQLSAPQPAPEAGKFDGWRRLFLHYHRGLVSAPEHDLTEAALTLGVFDHLLAATGPVASSTMAHTLACDPAGMDLLLRGLAAMGFVHASEGGFALVPEAAQELRERRDSLVWRMREASQWRRLADRIRHGRTADVVMAGGETATWLAAIGETQESRLRAEVRALGLRGDERVMDVGSGGGRYAAEFLRQHPHLHVTLVDYPQSLPAALAFLQAHGVADRAEILQAPFFDDDWTPPPGYQVAWVSGVVHSAGPATNRSLMRRLYDALEPGGRVLVLEQTADETLLKRLNAFNYYVMSDQAQAYTADELLAMLRDAGFAQVRAHEPGWATVFEGVKLASR